MIGVILKSKQSDHVYGIAKINKSTDMVTLYDVRDAVTALIKHIFKDSSNIQFVWGAPLVTFTSGGAAPYVSTMSYIHTETVMEFTPT